MKNYTKFDILMNGGLLLYLTIVIISGRTILEKTIITSPKLAVQAVPVSKKTSTTKNINVKPIKEYTDYETAVWFIKSKESLRLEAYWDYHQYSIGFGTKSKKGEKITLEEANRRFKKEFTKRYNYISNKYPRLERFQKLMITGVYYNVGKFGPNLDLALKENNVEEINRQILKYINAGGKENDGLIKRRKDEVELLKMDKDERNIFTQKLREIVKNKIIKAK